VLRRTTTDRRIITGAARGITMFGRGLRALNETPFRRIAAEQAVGGAAPGSGDVTVNPQRNR
jgi:hypothetical protein